VEAVVRFTAQGEVLSYDWPLFFAAASNYLEDRIMGTTFLGLIAAILDIFAIYDVMNSSRDTATKVVLLAIILFVPFIGAGLYLFALRDKGFA